MDARSSVELENSESMSATQEEAVVSEKDSSEAEWVPEGPTYPLNSKHMRGSSCNKLQNV